MRKKTNQGSGKRIMKYIIIGSLFLFIFAIFAETYLNPILYPETGLMKLISIPLFFMSIILYFSWKINWLRWIILVTTLILITLFVSIFYITGGDRNFGRVRFPQEPDIPRPDDLRYCETDEDCTHTTLQYNGCCLGWFTAINLEGKTYLEAWHELNCKNFDVWKNCWELHGSAVEKDKCINNRCEVVFFK